MTTKVYLKVTGLTGPSTASGYAGDYDVDSYSFGATGVASYDALDIALSDPAYAAGVLRLYEQLLTPTNTLTATLYVTDTVNGIPGVVDEIFLKGVTVTSYADNGGGVSLELGYTGATVTATDQTGAFDSVGLGASTPSAGQSDPTPADPGGLLFLSASGVTGTSTVAGFTGDVPLIGYSFGNSFPATSDAATFDPLVITLSSYTQGAAQLLADAAAGATLSHLTLYRTTASNTTAPAIEYAIALTDATVVAEAEGNGESVLAFDYSSVTITGYTLSQTGTSPVAGTPYTYSDIGSFTTPVLPSLPASEANNDFLAVTGLTGPSKVTGYTGDFTVASYALAPASGYLDVTLDQTAGASGVLGLYEDALVRTPMTAATLYVTQALGAGQEIEEIALTGAFVASYADAGGDVAIALGYRSATVTVTTYNHLGTTQTSSVFDTPTASLAPQVAPSPGTPAGSLFLSVTGVDGGVALTAFANDFRVMGYSLGDGDLSDFIDGSFDANGEPDFYPLTVTLAADNPGTDALLADLGSAPPLSSVTLYETNTVDTLTYAVTLFDVSVLDVQQVNGVTQVAFGNYRKIGITDYTLSANGSSSTVAKTYSISASGLEHASAPVPSPSPQPDLSGALTALALLNVAGLTGPSNVTGFSGDFQLASYSFGATLDAVGAPALGPLYVDLGPNAAPLAGVDGLYQDLVSMQALSSVTLYFVPTIAGVRYTTEKIVLNNAYIGQYDDSGGDVSLQIDFGSATVTVISPDASGTGTTVTTTTISNADPVAGSDTVPAPSAASGTLVLAFPFLVNAGTTVTDKLTVTGYSFGGGALPLTVTFADYGTIANHLLTEVATGTVLPTVTLTETDSSKQIDYRITLTNAVAERLQDTDGLPTVSFTYDSATVGDAAVACFLIGTRIATPRGEVPVEDLRIGDRAATVSGRSRPIVWIGRRGIDAARHPTPADVLPVRIRRDAFGPGAPHRDLFLSPDHAVLADGMLIPVKRLTNGRTIVQEGMVPVTYYHLELAQHDVLLAEGLPVESYIDTGNRASFANGGATAVLHPNFSGVSGRQQREGRSCFPFAVADADVEPVWRRLADIAARLGYPAPPACETTTDAGVSLLVGERRLRPVETADGALRFVLPASVREVRLCSRADRPTRLRPWRDDGRLLGLSVARLRLRGARTNAWRDIPMDHPELRHGWQAVERDGDRLWRWTDGAAQLPDSVFADLGRVVIIDVFLCGSMQYATEATDPARPDAPMRAA